MTSQNNTLYGLSIESQWEQILEIHALKLAKQYRPDWYRWRLTNNYERAVFLKGDPVYPREAARYIWANQNLLGEQILEIGCSSGYGSQFLPTNIHYLGLDYDPLIINVAREQRWGADRHFQHADINQFQLGKYDTIIAFEVIEHLDNGLELVSKLQEHCNRLLITVPHNEPKGFWGEHHKLHGLDETLFPDFKISYINEHGYVTRTLQPVNEQNKANLMLLRWDRV
jgi:2-polyprenyl-3-methyl-5-hydroxy-6-metoxy-1,4-benzoquinol methylase